MSDNNTPRDALAPRVYVRTFGCQMNVHDSERMIALLRQRGYVLVDSPDGADVVIVNTCEVRDKADQKMLSAIGRLRASKQEHPGQQVVVAGCGAQLRGAQLLERNPHIDVVVGPDQIGRLPEWLDQARRQGQTVIATDWWQGYGPDPAERLPQEFVPGSISAFVTAMTGCNNFCTYCIVPTTRGRERSRPLQAIVDEVAHLTERGVREVTLLGQCIDAYGRDLADKPSFGALLQSVASVPALSRLRFMTSHPRYVDDSLVQAFAQEPKICSHLHLPAQSGSDRILKAMRRRYDRATIIDKVQRLRQARPDLSLTTDFIVGFPGETEADFADTLDLVETLKFAGMFSFAYSERPGTPAAELADSVPPALRSERLARLNAAQEPYNRQALERWVGQDVEVLVDGVSARNSDRLAGRLGQNIVVNFSGHAAAGQLVQVHVEAAKANTLDGQIL